MCGIVGALAPRRSGGDLEAIVGAMNRTVRHRGPDSGGLWGDPVAGIALAHSRLAVVDLSEAGAQPMVSGSGRFVLTYNGEIYNGPALRKELAGPGVTFRGHSDTEIMLAAIECWGLASAVQRFVGMFAFALWDREQRTLHLVRDRLGIKPLYYAHADGGIYFGSELRAVRPCLKAVEFDPQAVAALLQVGFIPAPLSIYREIRKLMPGTILSVGAANTNTTQYWSLSEHACSAPAFAGTEQDAIEAAAALVQDSVQGCMVADVPTGVLLSGGIDSSTVAAVAQSNSNAPVQTFSIGFDVAAFDEAPAAAAIARHLGTDHTELRVTTADALDAVAGIATIYDEPFADSSQVPTYLVSQLARQKVVVCLTGDGGDEVFGGYNRYLWTPKMLRMIDGVPRGLRRAAHGAVSALGMGGVDRVFNALSALMPGEWRPRNAGERAAKLMDILDIDSRRELYAAYLSVWRDARSALAQPAAVNIPALDAAGAPDDIVRQIMLNDALYYLPDDVLTKVDRASMAVALEVRVPLLDHRLLELAATMPLAFKIRGGRGKWLLRQILRRYVPDHLFTGPKWGFAAPIDEWLRGPLRPWAAELLQEAQLTGSGMLKPPTIRYLWKRHLERRCNAGAHLWPVLMFEAWRRGGAGEPAC